jgi:NAD(P)H-flavin reductase
MSCVTKSSICSHLKKFDGEYDPFVWACAAIWCLDRAISLGKILALNFGVFYGRLPKAQATYQADQNVIRLLVRPSFHKKPSPGSHYFLYFPAMWRGWESHPFTLSSYENVGARDIARVREVVDKASENSTSADSQSSGSLSQDSISESNSLELSFLIRPQDGFTSRLKKKVLSSTTSRASLTVFLEGPYGATHPLHRYSNVLLIVGGSGITAALPYIQDFIERSASSSAKSETLRLVWTARGYGLVKSVLENELRLASTHACIALDIFTTDSLGYDESEKAESGAVSVTVGRPDVKEIITQMKIASGDAAVMVCGPAKLADQARRTVVELIEGDGTRIDYFEEQFGW